MSTHEPLTAGQTFPNQEYYGLPVVQKRTRRATVAIAMLSALVAACVASLIVQTVKVGHRDAQITTLSTELARTQSAKVEFQKASQLETMAKLDLGRQVADLQAKLTAATAKPTPAATKADDTTMVVTISADDVSKHLGLISICNVPRNEQSEFLLTTFRHNKGEDKVRAGRDITELSDLDDVFANERWTVVARLCHRE